METDKMVLDNLDYMIVEIKEFIKNIDQNIGVEIGEHSCAYTDTNDIVIGLYSTLYRDNVVDLAHEDYYRKNGFNYEEYGIYYETFILLHEIGHLQTVPTKREDRKYNRLQKRIENSKMNDYEKLIAYFKLDVEVNADNWAIEYIRKFPTVVQDLNKAIHSFKTSLLSQLKK